MREYSAAIIEIPFHVYNRGVDKRVTFSDYSEYCRFVFLMYICRIGKPAMNLSRKDVERAVEAILAGKEPDKKLFIEEHKPLVAFISWNLLSNHFHFYLISLVEGGISKYMQKLTNAYTKYFNARHERTGSLFQGPFQSIEIKESRHCGRLLAYININHVELIEPHWKEQGIQDLGKVNELLKSYKWSAHLDFIGKRHSLLIDRHLVSELFGEDFMKKGPLGYQEFIKEWLPQGPNFTKYALE